VFFKQCRQNLGETNAREIKHLADKLPYMQSGCQKEVISEDFINGCVKKEIRSIDIAFNNAGRFISMADYCRHAAGMDGRTPALPEVFLSMI